MKYLLLFICAVLLLLAPFGTLFANEESENLETKRIWNLLEDIKDYQAGRLNYGLWPGTSMSVPNNDDPVSIIYTEPDPMCIPYFWFRWPIPAINNNLVVELDFKWPNSTGYLLFLFDTWNENAIQNSSQIIGVLLKYGKNRGIYVGDVLSVLKDDLKPEKYTKKNLGIMGKSRIHTLKIVVKQKRIYAVLDNDSMLAWSGNTSPSKIVMLGNGIYPAINGEASFIIHRLQMNVNMIGK